jgi:hypothetical protein
VSGAVDLSCDPLVAARKAASACWSPGTAARVPPLADAQGHDVTGRWPLRSFLELGALPGAVPCARLHTRQLLWEWQLTGLSDNAELLVSEIVTNTIQITQADGRTAPVRLWLLTDRAGLLILVWDASPLPPVRVSTSDDAENGRGLLLVDTISNRWDWYTTSQTGGKVVWALLHALTTGHGSREHGTNLLREGAPPVMSSPASPGSAERLPGATFGPGPVRVSAPAWRCRPGRSRPGWMPGNGCRPTRRPCGGSRPPWPGCERRRG